MSENVTKPVAAPAKPAAVRVAAEAFQEVGANVFAAVEGDWLLLRVNRSAGAIAAAPMSKSGKNKLLSSTGGFTKFQGLGLSINVTHK